jgi:hypothetical protein
VTSTPWDAQGEAQAALRVIVSDPRYGPAALLQSNVAEGMDVATASRLTAGSLETQTALTPEACSWAVAVLASALRLDAVTAGPAHDTSRPPANGQQTVAPGAIPDSPRWAEPPPVHRAGAYRPDGAGLTGAVMTAAGAILVIWACALPYLHVPSDNGRTSFSIFNSGSGGGFWFAVEPLGVGIVSVGAALIIVFARSGRMRLLASGSLIGFGIQTILLFVGYEFSIRSPDHTGPAAAVGILGGIVLLLAGIVAAVSRPAQPAVMPVG